MNAAQVLTAVALALNGPVADLGGVVVPAGTPADVQDMLKTGPSQWRLILLMASGSEIWRHLGSKANLVVIIQTAVPPTAKKGADIFQSRGAGKLSVLDLENEVINLMRRIQFQTPEGEAHPKLDSPMPHVKFENHDWLISAEEELILPTRERRLIFSVEYAFDDFPAETLVIPCPVAV